VERTTAKPMNRRKGKRIKTDNMGNYKSEQIKDQKYEKLQARLLYFTQDKT
jgi:hypothetical protein